MRHRHRFKQYGSNQMSLSELRRTTSGKKIKPPHIRDDRTPCYHPNSPTQSVHSNSLTQTYGYPPGYRLGGDIQTLFRMGFHLSPLSATLLPSYSSVSQPLSLLYSFSTVLSSVFSYSFSLGKEACFAVVFPRLLKNRT